MLCLPKQGTTVAPKRRFISSASGFCTRDCSLCGLSLDQSGMVRPAKGPDSQWLVYHNDYANEDSFIENDPEKIERKIKLVWCRRFLRVGKCIREEKLKL